MSCITTLHSHSAIFSEKSHMRRRVCVCRSSTLDWKTFITNSVVSPIFKNFFCFSYLKTLF